VPARPSPKSLTPRTLEESLARAEARSLYLIEGGEKKGTDRIAIARCAELIRARVLGPEAADADWNETILSGEKIPLAVALDAALTLPLLGGRRLVVVRAAGEVTPAREEAAQKEQIAAIQRVAVEGSPAVLVFVDPPLDGRLKVHKALREAACVVVCASPDPAAMPSWIAESAREAKLSLARGTAEALAEIVGPDTLAARQEIEKLSIYVSSRPAAERAATPADVAAVGRGGALADSWKMADAVASLDEAKALRLARDLMDGGEEPIALIGALAFRARGMLEASEAFGRRVPIPGILAQVRAWGAFRDILAGHVARYDAAGLLEGLRSLYRADRACKSGSDPRETLLTLISRLIRLAAGAPVRL